MERYYKTVPFNQLDDIPCRQLFYKNKEEDLNKINSELPINFLPNFVKNCTYKGESCVLLVGTLMSRLKASVIVKNIPIYFDVLFSYNVKNSFDSIVQNELGYIDHEVVKECKEINEFKPFFKAVQDYEKRYSVLGKYIGIKLLKEYMKYPVILGCRFTFKTSKERNEALKHAYNYDEFYLTSNATQIITNIFGKSGKLSGNWVSLTNYEKQFNMVSSDKFKYKDSEINANDKWSYKTKADVCFILNFEDYLNVEDPIMVHPNVICSMDIETCSVIRDASKKSLIDESNIIFNITCYITDTEKELDINIYFTRDKKYHPEIGIDNAFNICCNSEEQVVSAYCRILEKIQPDIIMHYNGNMFDIPLILLKLRQYNIFDEMFCRTSISYLDSYLDSYNDDKIIEINGTKYQNTYNKFTYWNKVNTNEEVSGLYEGCGLSHPRINNFKFDPSTTLPYHYWSPPGSITVDLYMHCSTKYKKEPSKSMNAFLKKAKIPLKDDVDYSDIWKYWLANNLQQIKIIMDYCKIDSRRCYQLAVSELYLPTNREFAEITGMSFEDTIYKAGTSKVLALLFQYANKYGYDYIEHKFSKSNLPKYASDVDIDHIYPEKQSFPGGYVHIHNKGKIHIDYELPKTDLSNEELSKKYTYEVVGDDIKYAKVVMPVEAVDFKSLYPSIIITFNLSYESMTHDYEQIKHVKHICIPADELGDFIDQDLYIVDHEGEYENMGIFPKIEKDLFAKRNEAKYKLWVHNEACEKIYDQTKKEFLEKNPNHGLSIDELVKKIKSLCDKNPEYVHNLNMKRAYDSKQLAVKILMNTGYGFLAYPRGMGYKYAMAYIITSKGRFLTQESNRFLSNLGCIINYNDTDSTYFTHDPDTFKDINERYFNDEFSYEKHKEKLVKRSIKKSLTGKQLIKHYSEKSKLTEEIKNKITLVDKLNNRFRELTNYTFLIMVREETLFPAMFLMDKKYFGFKHEQKYIENPSMDDVMYRGISIVCRNTSQFVADINKELVLSILRSTNVDVRQFVYNRIEKCYHDLSDPNLNIPYSYFENKQRYKFMTCSNTATIVVKNMLALHNTTTDSKLRDMCIEPDGLEVVKYVLCESEKLVDLKMRKYKSTSKGVRQYYTHVAEYLGLKLDYESYIPTIFSSCAQMLTYCTDFLFYKPEIKSKDYKQMIQNHLVRKYKNCDDNKLLGKEIALKWKKITDFKKQYKDKAYYNWVNNNYSGIERKALLLYWNNNCKDMATKLENMAKVIGSELFNGYMVKGDIKIVKLELYKLETMWIEKCINIVNEIEVYLISEFNNSILTTGEVSIYISESMLNKIVYMYKFLFRYSYLFGLSKRLINDDCEKDLVIQTII